MSHHGKRPFGERRLLGDARREASEAIHIAASKRRRLADAGLQEEENEDEGPVSHTLGDDDAAIFADTVYEQDDAEADAIYAAVDARMASRRQKQREERLQKELRDYRRANPTIKQQFADLKSELGKVSTDQWAAIPDIGDYSVKKQKFQKFTPAPDSLLERARQETAYVSSEPAADGTNTDLASIGAGRSSVLGLKLDKAGDSVSGKANVDADGYLSEMAGVRVSTDSEIGDIKKARLLLKSVTATNPAHAPGWIAAARLEETAGKLATARELILEGCAKCPREEDVWVEAARLYPRETGRRILAQAIKTVPRSVKIWLQAATLEEDTPKKRRVLRKGLEIIPRSSELWMAAVELEDPIGARILLSRAVECAPKSKELWLALARLEPYERAKSILQRAQKALPTELAIYISAAQLEETRHGASSVEIQSVVQNGFKTLCRAADATTRESWLVAAQDVDEVVYPGTVKAIIESAIGFGVEDAAREGMWTADAQMMEARNCKEAARAIYGRLTRTFQTRSDLWQSFVDFERRCGNQKALQNVLLEAVDCCPQAELLWLMLAKDKWKSEGADAARRVLSHAFEANPDSEAIWLAAAKVETETGEYEKARSILKRARLQAGSAKVYMKSALLERQLSRRGAERELLECGLELFSDGEKLWLMLAQWHERSSPVDELNGLTGTAKRSNGSSMQHLSSARAVYVRSVEACTVSAPLWISYARYEELRGTIAKARAVLERGREKCKDRTDADGLWRESAYLEVRAGQVAAARGLVARGLQKHKQSGRLWALSVALEPRSGQKSRSADAIRACPQSAHVLLEVARYLWRSAKVDKARQWVRRAVEVDADFGDAWAAWLAFEQAHGDSAAVAEVARRADEAEPRHGDAWVAVSKKLGNERLGVRDVLERVAELSGKESFVTGIYDT